MQAKDVDPRDPIQIAMWMQRMEDRLDHLHDCVERKAREAEELNESRHQENRSTLAQLQASLDMATAFIENANKGDVARQAVAGYKKQQLEKWSNRRHFVLEFVKYASGSTAIAIILRLLAWILGYHG